MAKGTQHRKRRTPANARVARAPSKGKSKQVKHQRWEDQLFFARLRLHAKWVFALLAIVFAGTFVFLGVGSGSTGIGDALQTLIGRSPSGTSASSLQKKAEEHPKQAKLWLDLATKLQADQKFDEAIVALKRYLTLRPKDPDVLGTLGGAYLQSAERARQAYIDSQTRSQILYPRLPSSPSSTSDLGKALAAMVGPVQSAVSGILGTSSSDAYSKYFQSLSEAVGTYKRLANVDPSDATTQLQLAHLAQNAGDTKTAIAAYKRFVKLAPDDPQAAAAKKALKQLQAQQAATATPSSSHK